MKAWKMVGIYGLIPLSSAAPIAKQHILLTAGKLIFFSKLCPSLINKTDRAMSHYSLQRHMLMLRGQPHAEKHTTAEGAVVC